MEYNENVKKHFTDPQNVGTIEDPSGVGTVGNEKCGDIMRVYIKVEDGYIVDVGFKTFGCAAAIATSSMATVLIKGLSVHEAVQVTNKAVTEALGGLPATKHHCSVLAEEAIHAALMDYCEKSGTVIEGLRASTH